MKIFLKKHKKDLVGILPVLLCTGIVWIQISVIWIRISLDTDPDADPDQGVKICVEVKKKLHTKLSWKY